MSSKPAWQSLRDVLDQNVLVHTDPTCFMTLLGELADRGVDHYPAGWISEAYKLGVQDDLADNSVSDETFVSVERRLVSKGLQTQVALKATNTWRKALGFSPTYHTPKTAAAPSKPKSVQHSKRKVIVRGTPTQTTRHGQLLLLLLLVCFGVVGVVAVEHGKTTAQFVTTDIRSQTEHPTAVAPERTTKQRPSVASQTSVKVKPHQSKGNPESKQEARPERRPKSDPTIASRSASARRLKSVPEAIPESRPEAKPASGPKLLSKVNPNEMPEIVPIQLAADAPATTHRSRAETKDITPSPAATAVTTPGIPALIAISAATEVCEIVRDFLTRHRPPAKIPSRDRTRNLERVTHSTQAKPTPMPKHSSEFLDAELASRRGEHKKAIVGFTNCIERGEANTWVYHGRAASRLHLKDYARARHDLDKAILLDDRNHLAFALRGLLKASVDRDLRSAAEDLDQALNLNNLSPYVYFVRAVAFSRGGSKELLRRAAIECEQAIEIVNKGEQPTWLHPDAMYLKKLIDSDINQLGSVGHRKNERDEIEDDPIRTDIDGALFDEGDPFADL